MGGGPADALLGALDPARRRRFRDRCVGLPLDLDGVLFVAVATDPGRIPPMLQERLEALPPAGYTDAEKPSASLQPAMATSQAAPDAPSAWSLTEEGRCLPSQKYSALNCCRTRESDRFEPGADPKMLWWRGHRPTDSFGVCPPPSRRVASPRPRFAGLPGLTAAPRTPVQTGHLSDDAQP